MTEAKVHFSRALDLLSLSPEGVERDERELSLTLGMGSTRMVTEGYMTEEVARSLARARELAADLRRQDDLGTALLASGVAAMVRGDLQESHGYGVELLRIAERTGSNAIRASAHFMLGMASANFGQLRTAEEHLNGCLEAVAREPEDSLILRYGPHPRVVALAYRAMGLSLMGLLDQGSRAQAESLEFARELGDPFTSTLGLAFASDLALSLYGADRALELCEELLTLTEEHEVPFWRAHGLVAKGRALVELGAVEEGVQLVQQASDSLAQTGGSSDGSVLRGEVYLAVGKIDEGLAVAREVRAYLAEIHEVAPDNPKGMAAPRAAIGAIPTAPCPPGSRVWASTCAT